MRGHEHMIQARTRGIKPAVINIIDYPFTLELEPTEVVVHGDRLLDIDLRFVADCLVTIGSTEQRRLDYLVSQCRKFHARQIAYDLYRKYYE